MVGFSTILSVAALVGLCAAKDAAIKKPNSALTKVAPKTQLAARSLVERGDFCSGTCVQCFGAGYILCPGSSLYCYSPGDPTYGIDSCPSDSSDTTSTAQPTPTGSTDYCYGKSCSSCFGAGYLACPDGISCYNPNDPQYDTCPSSSGSSTSCADLYGTGSEPCGADNCYNPGAGEVCCDDGSYCNSGKTCSSPAGYCCSPGSSSSDCSSGLLSSLSNTYSSSSHSHASSTAAASTPTSAGGRASSASSAAAITGTSQSNIAGSSDGVSVEANSIVGLGAVLGLMGIGMLLL